MKMLRCRLAGAAFLLLPLATAAAPAALPVFDPTNYAQNLLQASRALEQINQQVQSLQNEAAMLRNMEQNLRRLAFPEVERMTQTLRRIDALIDQAKGIDFRVDSLDSRLRALFPGEMAGAGGDEKVASARARLEAADEALRRSIQVQAQVAENVKEDAALLARLAGRGDGAEGSLQAQQAANQLLALSAKQQLQLQSLLAAEFRSQAIERARIAQAESDGRAATRRFLGSGRAYSPR